MHEIGVKMNVGAWKLEGYLTVQLFSSLDMLAGAYFKSTVLDAVFGRIAPTLAFQHGTS